MLIGQTGASGSQGFPGLCSLEINRRLEMNRHLALPHCQCSIGSAHLRAPRPEQQAAIQDAVVVPAQQAAVPLVLTAVQGKWAEGRVG